MAGPTQAETSFPNGSPPKSCLELLAELQKLRRLVEARIEWKASWPAVNRNTPEVSFPIFVYVGKPPQSIEEWRRAESLAREDEFKKLQETLPRHFTAIKLPVPSPSEFATGSDFWVQQAAIILAEAFNGNELIRGWIPEVTNGASAVDPSADEKAYPPFPIRSLNDMELWLCRWIDRCALPDRPMSPSEWSRRPREGKIVTIQVPSIQPQFQSPDENVWRCSLDDLKRELHNSSLAFHVWRLPIETDWLGEPPDFSTAEDRVLRVIKLLRGYPQSVFDDLGKRWSVEEISQMPVPDLLAKLAAAKAHPPGQGGGKKASDPEAESEPTNPVNPQAGGDGAGSVQGDTGGGQSTLRRCDTKAGSQYEHAMTNNPELTTDKAAYDWYLDNGVEDGETLPSFETWCKYVRRYRAASGGQKNRGGVGHETRSVVSGAKIEYQNRTEADFP